MNQLALIKLTDLVIKIYDLIVAIAFRPLILSAILGFTKWWRTDWLTDTKYNFLPYYIDRYRYRQLDMEIELITAS